MEGEECETDLPHKIIFLDVDGVLNNKHITHQIATCLVSRLARLVKEMDASIVLSSMWRLKKKNRTRVKEAFLKQRLPLPISCTPFIVRVDGWKNVRVNEILSWLQQNTTLQFQEDELIDDTLHFIPGNFSESEYVLPVRINVSHWVVLDDIDMWDYGGEHRHMVHEHHFVLTLMKTGLTEHNLDQARFILSGGKSGSMIPNHCEECRERVPENHDSMINKYFCDDECRLNFHLRHLNV